MTPAAALRAAVVVAAALVAATSARADETPQAPPLANEDIVRMVAAGVSESEILDAVRTRPATFDVSDDMVEELRLAGVPAAVIAAMKARQERNAAPSEPAERPRAGRARLIVTFASSRLRTLRAPAYADEDAKARLRLPREVDQRQVHDLAVFLACSSAEHVPDLWRSKTPLGRDLNLTSRHEMLAFVPGDTPPGKTPRLALPATLEADVDDTEPHDLILGVAALIGDHWVQLAAAVLPKTKVPPGAKPLTGRIDPGPHPLEFKLTLAAPAP